MFKVFPKYIGAFRLTIGKNGVAKAMHKVPIHPIQCVNEFVAPNTLTCIKGSLTMCKKIKASIMAVEIMIIHADNNMALFMV